MQSRGGWPRDSGLQRPGHKTSRSHRPSQGGPELTGQPSGGSLRKERHTDIAPSTLHALPASQKRRPAPTGSSPFRTAKASRPEDEAEERGAGFGKDFERRRPEGLGPRPPRRMRDHGRDVEAPSQHSSSSQTGTLRCTRDSRSPAGCRHRVSPGLKSAVPPAENGAASWAHRRARCGGSVVPVHREPPTV